MLTLNSDVVYTIVNLILLAVLLRLFLWKPVLGILDKRRQTIQDDLDRAAKTREEAQEAKNAYEASLTGAREESAALVERARTEAGAKYDAILAQANADAAAIREKARAEARTEKEQLLDQARGEVADLALLAAAQLLGRVDEETDRRILDDFLAETGGLS